jgi:hypothetical protein
MNTGEFIVDYNPLILMVLLMVSFPSISQAIGLGGLVFMIGKIGLIHPFEFVIGTVTMILFIGLFRSK